MVAVLLIAVCYAAGLAVHYRWYERTAKPWLSFDDPVERARWRERSISYKQGVHLLRVALWHPVRITRARSRKRKSPSAANGRGCRGSVLGNLEVHPARRT
jgi:hypothetical protein